MRKILWISNIQAEVLFKYLVHKKILYLTREVK